MKAVLYCKKEKPYLYHDEDYCFDTMNTIDLGYKTMEYTNQRVYDDETGKFLGWETYGNMYKDYSLNGKIVAECDIEVEEIGLVEIPDYAGTECHTFVYDVYINFETKTLNQDKLFKKSCLNWEEMEKYLYSTNGKGYAIHIKNLHIFNRPLELNRWTVKKPKVVSDIICDSCTNFDFNCKKCEDYWDYYPLEKAPNNVRIVYDQLEKRVFIPISSNQMCNILNEEQTIIVRKYVPKEIRL